MGGIFNARQHKLGSSMLPRSNAYHFYTDGVLHSIVVLEFTKQNRNDEGAGRVVVTDPLLDKTQPNGQRNWTAKSGTCIK